MRAVAWLLPLPTSLLLLLPALLLGLDAAHSSYNSVYNDVITPELKEAIDKDLPKQAKFFDELDCKYASLLPKSFVWTAWTEYARYFFFI